MVADRAPFLVMYSTSVSANGVLHRLQQWTRIFGTVHLAIILCGRYWASFGMAWFGPAWLGEARLGRAGRGEARSAEAWRGAAGQVWAWKSGERRCGGVVSQFELFRVDEGLAPTAMTAYY